MHFNSTSLSTNKLGKNPVTEKLKIKEKQMKGRMEYLEYGTEYSDGRLVLRFKTSWTCNNDKGQKLHFCYFFSILCGHPVTTKAWIFKMITDTFFSITFLREAIKL